jgi:hypothetical protein
MMLDAGEPANLPIMGIYESSEARSYNVANNHNLIDDFTGRGFGLVLNYNAPGPIEFAEIPYCQEYADYLHSKGGKIIWEMRYYKNHMNLLPDAVNALKDKPATYGWYIADEPSPSDPDIVALNDSIKSLDPAHPTVVVVGWWLLRNGACGSGITTVNYLNGIKDYADIIGIDYYPLDLNGDGIPEGSCEEDDMNEIIAAGYNWTKANGKKWGLVLQAFSNSVAYHGGSDNSTWPTITQMKRWRDIGMQNSRPEFILWYSYFDARWYYPPQIDSMQQAAFDDPYSQMP